ncbi:sulfurtransferase [Desulfoluna spongiiphila]|uniref:sulfurtransferase n=1 Tax=Desulfoluna spongiiphila TaxID=419481 RepID=UPI001252EB66|nr:rhodanese-like domain-containing protein [Desulfoluna spongiiphila]VVS92624.1 rhodanese-like domain [Desulfoluna spongiiphila]
MQKRLATLIPILMLVVSVCVVGVPAGAVERITPGSVDTMEEKPVILDARPKKAWAKGHIPGSFSFNWEEYTKTDDQKIPYRTFPPKEMAVALGALGIQATSPIVITGDADDSWGGEGWIAWFLEWIGHQGPVYLLDGGMPGWIDKNLPLKEQPEGLQDAPLMTLYTPTPDPAVFITAEDLLNNPDTYTLVDTRSFPEWLTGHIPGAVHISWKKMVDKNSRTPISPGAMNALLAKKKIPLDKPVVYYCTGGVRSGWAWMAHTMAGLPTAFNLEGGYEEWNAMEK